MSWEHTPQREGAQAQRFYEAGYAGGPEGEFHRVDTHLGHEERPANSDPTMNATSYATNYEYSTYNEPPQSAYAGQVMQPVQPVQPPPASQGYVFYGWQPLFMRVGESSNSRAAAVLSYLVGWFSGIVLLFFGFQNKYVRFHALQSLLFFGFINLADIVMFVTGGLGWRIFGHIHYIGGVYGLAIFGSFILLNALAFIGWIVCMAMAGSGKTYKIPAFGHLAARLSGLETSIPPTVK